MGIFILLLLISFSVIGYVIYVDYKKKEKARIKKELEYELAEKLIDKMHDDFSVNSNENKILYSYHDSTYIFNDGRYIELKTGYDYSFRFIYQSYDTRYDFEVNDYIEWKFKSSLKIILTYIQQQRKYNDYYSTNKKTYTKKTKKKSTADSKDIKKYNKLVKIFKLRKKQLTSMNPNNKDYQPLKNEYLVLVDKLTELKKKI